MISNRHNWWCSEGAIVAISVSLSTRYNSWTRYQHDIFDEVKSSRSLGSDDESILGACVHHKCIDLCQMKLKRFSVLPAHLTKYKCVLSQAFRPLWTNWNMPLLQQVTEDLRRSSRWLPLLVTARCLCTRRTSRRLHEWNTFLVIRCSSFVLLLSITDQLTSSRQQQQWRPYMVVTRDWQIQHITGKYWYVMNIMD